jgi:hypothetical protein
LKNRKHRVSIIGGGPSALFLATFLDSSKFNISIYEKNKALGRKFLVAGKGGFNLTHSEPLESFKKKYQPAHFLDKYLDYFSNSDLTNYLEAVQIPTFIGSSKRVYPQKGIKPIEVLNTLLSVLEKNGVKIHFKYEWKGWSQIGELVFDKKEPIESDLTIFSLGGGTWEVTGSNSKWHSYFQEKGIKINPFEAANCAFKVDWQEDFILKNAGKPLKNINLKIDDFSSKGELVISEFGLEGNAIYAASSWIRNTLSTEGKATIFLDLKPNNTLVEIHDKIVNSKSKNISECLKKELNIKNQSLDLLKLVTNKNEFSNPTFLAEKIKNLPIEICGISTLDEAISSIGGVDLSELDENLQLRKMENNFCIGEMLDWDAPTGGYLLQACFSMGVFLAHHLNENSTN